MNDFLTRAIQRVTEIYNKFNQEEDFHIYFYLYVTNNSSKTQSIQDAIAKFNQKYAQKMEARFFSLNDIQEIYFKEEPLVNKKSFSYDDKSQLISFIEGIFPGWTRLAMRSSLKASLVQKDIKWNMYPCG